jgi:hypothetical protein
VARHCYRQTAIKRTEVGNACPEKSPSITELRATTIVELQERFVAFQHRPGYQRSTFPRIVALQEAMTIAPVKLRDGEFR